METILILLFLALALCEGLLSYFQHRNNYSLRETLVNIGIGCVSFCTDYLFALISVPFMMFLYKQYSFVYWNKQWHYYIVLFVSLDFIEYWFHRICHKWPPFWSVHKVHHQSKKFNMSVGLRTSFLVPIINVAFYCALPLLGFDAHDIFLFIMLQGFLQLLVHTELIGSLGWLDRVLVTPSVHRVHHGINEQYIDKNFGKTLALWDHLFRTYAKEEERVIYGATHAEGEVGIFSAQMVPVKKWWKGRR